MKINNIYNGWVEINIDNLIHNIKTIRDRVGSSIKIMAIVKANSYGHGANHIAPLLLKYGADFLGVATAEEGKLLRNQGVKSKIFLTSAVLTNQINEIIKWDLTPFVYNKDYIQALNKEAFNQQKIVSVHVKIDTGMGRLGVAPENFFDFLNEFKKLKNLKIEGVLTHFASADKDRDYTYLQLKHFKNVVEDAQKKGWNFDFIHTANSASVIQYPDTYFNMVRPGLALYGLYPNENLKDKIDLKPVMSIKSKIAFTKQVPQNTSISYGCTFVTKRESIIATIPIGYADGFSRHFSNNFEVLINGKRAKVAGTVCMDSFMVDITDFNECNVKIGDIVTLLGKDGNDEISADDWAKKLNTINYEIVCNIGQRLLRFTF